MVWEFGAAVVAGRFWGHMSISDSTNGASAGSGAKLDDAARLEAALERIARVHRSPRPIVLGDDNAIVAGPGPDIAALAGRLDALISELRALLKAD